MSKLSKLAVVCSLTALGAVAGATALKVTGVLPSAPLLGSSPAGSGAPPVQGAAAESETARGSTYIVVYREAPLASYKGEVAGLDAAPIAKSGPARGRMDVNSAEAKRYVRHLEGVQRDHEARIARGLGRQMKVRKRMQHALNGAIVELSASEADLLRKMDDVAFVEAYHEYELAGDTGNGLIGAPAVWNGTTPLTSSRFKGEGVVVGIIDTGINFGSPSFAAVSPIDGYQHVNPRGSGNYLGTCAPGGVDEGRCNDKLIGGYDFVCDVAPNASLPAQTYCTQTGQYREEPGFGDTNNHGTHVASTAAGNPRDVNFKGATLRISGVAPRANIVAYDTCFTNLATGTGSCPNVSTVAAINQAVADGVVNVLNYSIGGGTNPWGDAVSQAFLNAADAGIYIAAAAGNSGPAANTMGHNQPWVGTTAASQHGRADFAFMMDVTGPGNVPQSVKSIILNEGLGGVAHATTIPSTTPMRISPRIDTADDGCAAFDANAFQGAIAVVRRGTCAFSIKVDNARDAGAVAVVVANNQAGAIAPSVPGTTIPAFGVTQVEGNALRDFGVANPTATARIPFPPVAMTNRADQLAAFSSRGPAANFEVVKPDVTAPGVSILAAYAGTTLTGNEQLVGLMNGTSMASPHHAGAAALLRQAHPTWSVPEIKSALAMTAKREVVLEDGLTAAGPFARGSGRIQVDDAMRAGLVLHETKQNYLAANPATGGSPAALNQPNLIKAACFERCVFTRTFRNTLTHRQAWAVKAEGLSMTVSPALFTVNPGATVKVTFTVNALSLPANGAFNFGSVVLQPQSAGNPNQPVLRMPVAISVRPAAIGVPHQVAATVPVGGTTTAVLPVSNVGGSRLSYSIDNAGNATAIIAATTINPAGTGYYSNRITNSTTTGQFAADDFVIHASTRITGLIADGFLPSGAQPLSTATGITWTIFSDAGGLPNGDPLTPGSAVWSYTALPTSAGVGTADASISLNLAAASQDVVLAPGRYWLVVSPHTTVANRWVWFVGSAAAPDSLNGLANMTTPTPGTWGANTTWPGLAWYGDALVSCGAPWLGAATPSSGQLIPDATSNVSLAINAAGMTAGNYTGYACVTSNDALRSRAAVRIALTVTP